MQVRTVSHTERVDKRKEKSRDYDKFKSNWKSFRSRNLLRELSHGQLAKGWYGDGDEYVHELLEEFVPNTGVIPQSKQIIHRFPRLGRHRFVLENVFNDTSEVIFCHRRTTHW